MRFVAPFAFSLAALSVPIVLMYMLRSRRTRTPVSSTMLWRIGQQNVSANTPWQPLKFSWLLLLQILALLLTILALARPARETSLPLSDHTVLIVDTSASMQADDAGRTRLDAAVRKAVDAVSQIAGTQRMSVVEAGPSARVVLSGSSDQRAIIEALSSLKPTDGPTDAASAFALGASLETADVPTILHFYSDGGVRQEDRAEVPGNLVHIPVGSARGNVAIARLSLGVRGGGIDAYVRLANSGTARIDAALVLEADGAQIARRPVRLEPESGHDVTISLPRSGASRVVASLVDVRAAPGTEGRTDAPRINALTADDVARVVLDRDASLRVLLVSPGNVFLESLVKSIPGAQLTVSETAVPVGGYALAIYDRVAPPAKLDVPSLVIASPSGAPGVTVTGALKQPVITFVQPRERVLEQVDLSRVGIRSAQQVRAPEMRSLVSAGDAPLLSVGVPGGRRLAYLAFDLRESNLPVQVAYPLLFGNLFSWLTHGEGGDRSALVAGDPLPLRVPGRADSMKVETPSGDGLQRSTARALFDETDRAGFYRVRYLAGDEAVGEETFAVNIPALESTLTPKPITGDLATRGQGSGRLAGLRAWGPGILAAVLVVLMLEWWLAHGKPTPRRRYDKRARHDTKVAA